MKKSVKSASTAQKNLSLHYQVSSFLADHVTNRASKAKSAVKRPLAKAKSGIGTVMVFSCPSLTEDHLKETLTWQKSKWTEKKKQDHLFFHGQHGPVWVYQKEFKKIPVSHFGLLEESVYSHYRDLAGGLWLQAQNLDILQIKVEWHSEDPMALMGFLVGLELSSYQFKNAFSVSTRPKPRFDFVFNRSWTEKNNFEKIKTCALVLGESTNWARHLVNLPPNLLNPESFSQIAVKVFSSLKNVHVQVWSEKKLKAENMNLHLNVGMGSESPPRLVRISYQPKSKKQPIAFVGKGITFDTGGLNLKPGSGMRLMKKDMGGAAACFGIARAAALLPSDQPLEFYLALAENSVDGKSYRPSDVIKARNGLMVEIHDTDAEGRLVLADALSLAADANPKEIIDLATLTGAIKVGLGADLPGLFSNDDGLSDRLAQAAQKAGEPLWRMPLYSKYFSALTSHFADMTNCGEGGFAGAITAALFLEKFVQRKPWAHLDIYAWNDKAQGAQLQTGGSGQMVQALMFYLFENKFSDWIN